MAAIEQELIEQIKKLDEAEQRQVFTFVQNLVNKDKQHLPSDAWLTQADAFQDELRKKYGENHFNSQQLLDELREESSEWPRP